MRSGRKTVPTDVLPPRQLSAEQRQLLRWFDSLGEPDRASLLAFAEFLATREEPGDSSKLCLPSLRRFPGPTQESVVAAIKRLSSSYSMLDTQAMLNDTASLMSAHILQGRPAIQVIDDLEDIVSRSLSALSLARFRLARISIRRSRIGAAIAGNPRAWGRALWYPWRSA